MAAALVVGEELIAGLVLDEDHRQPVLLQVGDHLALFAAIGAVQAQGPGVLQDAGVVGTVSEVVAVIGVPLHDALARVFAGIQQGVQGHRHRHTGAAGGLDGLPLGPVVVVEFAEIRILVQRIDPGLVAVLRTALAAAQGVAQELFRGGRTGHAGAFQSDCALVGLHCRLGAAAEGAVDLSGIITLPGQGVLDGHHGIFQGRHGIGTGAAVGAQAVGLLEAADSLPGLGAVNAVGLARQEAQTDEGLLQLLDLGGCLCANPGLDAGGGLVDGLPGGAVRHAGLIQSPVLLELIQGRFGLGAEMAVGGTGGKACVLQLHLEPDHGIFHRGLGGFPGVAVGRQAEFCLEFLHRGLGLGAVAAVGGAFQEAQADEILLQLLDLGPLAALLQGSGLGGGQGEQRKHRHQSQQQSHHSLEGFRHWHPPHPDRWS